MDFARCRWIVFVSLIVIIVLIVIILSDGPEPPVDPEWDLVLTHGDVGTWLSLNNDVKTEAAVPVYDRLGLIFQLGDLKRSIHEYNGFTVYHSETKTEFARGDSTNVYWVNIVADSLAGEPILPEQAFELFPGGPADDCKSLWEISADKTCVRTSTINPHMNQGHALITFWQGEGAWKMQTTASKDVSNRYSFEFPDPFYVQVWQSDLTVESPSWTPKEEWHWAQSEVDSIVVNGKGEGPDRGEAQAPPWIYP